MFIGVAATICQDVNNTMAVNGKVELNDLQKEIAQQIAQEKAEDDMMLANFDDTLPAVRNPLATTTRSTRLVTHVN